MESIGDGVAIVPGASTPDSDAAFRQGNDFYYLTGVEAPDARLVIDGQRKESILFLTMDEKAADGLGLPVELARSTTAYTGIERSPRRP